MAFNAMDFFRIGGELGKLNRSSLDYASDSLLDQFNKAGESNRDIGKLMAIEKYKNDLQSPKETADTELTRQKSEYFKKLVSGGSVDAPMTSEGDFVVDRYGPNGPTYVNQQARMDAKMKASQAEQLPKLDRAFDAVQALKSQYNRSIKPVSIQSGGNPFAGFIQKQKQGIGANIGSVAGTNPEMNRFKANRAGFASLLSKGGFMEAGVLTNQDIDRMLNILPNEYSTEEEANIAWNEVESVLHSARERFESNGRGGAGRADHAEDISSTSNVITPEAALEELRRRGHKV